MKASHASWSVSLVLGGLALLGLLVYGYCIPSSGFYWVDFPVFYTAGQKALAHQTVYDVVGHFQFKYSPLIALIFGGLWGWAPFASASWVFQKSMLILYLWIGGILCLQTVHRNPVGMRLSRALETGLVLLMWLFGALVLELKLGQINAVVLSLLVLLFVPSVSGKQTTWIENPIWRGLLFSLALQLKLYVLIFGVLLILNRRWMELAATVVWTVLLCGGILSLVHGPQFAWSECAAWAVSLTQSSSDLITHHTNAGLLGFYSRTFGRTSGGVLWLASLLGYGGVLLWVRARKFRLDLQQWELSWALLGIVLFNPLVWSYWVLLLMPVLAPLARKELDVLQSPNVDWKRKVGVFGIGLLFTALWNFQQAHATRLYGVLAGTLVVAWLSLLRPLRSRGTS